MFNRAFPQDRDDEPDSSPANPFEAIFRPLKGERPAEVIVRYENGVEIKISFPSDEEDGED